MENAFIRSVEELLRGFGKGKEPRETPASEPAHPLEDRAQDRREWFARFAEEQIIPRLQQSVISVERHGAPAQCTLKDYDGALAAELVIYPPGLSAGAKPPRLTIRLADGDRPLAVDYTGTFPHSGATGGFGAEIDYDLIYPSQLEEQILGFIALAVGRV